MTRRTIALALAAGTLLAAAPLPAQDAPSRTNGLLVGVHVLAASLEPDGPDPEPERGGGVGLTLGWGLTSVFTLYLGVDASEIHPDDDEDHYTLASYDLGGRFSFGGGRRWAVPYLDVAFAGFDVVQDTEEGEVSASGTGMTLGGGMQWFIRRRLAIDASVKVSMGTLQELEVDGDVIEEELDEDILTTRLRIGVSWRPWR